jgi:hypothetical protein
MRIRVALVLGIWGGVWGVWAATAHADKIDDLGRDLRADPDYKVRLSAALNLGKLGDRRGIAALVDGLHDSDKTVRSVSAGALGRLVDGAADAAERGRALAALAAAAQGDPDAMVRAQAQKSVDAVHVGVYVEIGPMADTTRRGAGVVPVMRRELEASFGRRAPAFQTRWLSGRSPSDAELRKHGTTAFFVDASITQLDAQSNHVACAVSLILATYPGKSMFGFSKGSGEIYETGPGALSDCVVAVIDDLVGSKIIPTIQSRVR